MHIVTRYVPEIQFWPIRAVGAARRAPKQETLSVGQPARVLKPTAVAGEERRQCSLRQRINATSRYIFRVALDETLSEPPLERVSLGRGAPHDDARGAPNGT